MRLKINIAGIKRPSHIMLLAVILSFCAWLCPDFGVLRKGFTAPEHPGPLEWFILFSWYLLIFTSLSLGQKLRASFAGPPHRRVNLPSLDSIGVYRTFTILAAVGTVSTLFRIFSTLPLLQALVYIYVGQANRLKITLYQDYSAGLLSLRYLVLYSASLAIYRIVKFRKLSFLNIANIVLLAMTTLISSRLILIATLVISAFLITYEKRSIKISVIKLAVAAGILFAVLSVLNSSRNSRFYANLNLSFTEASISEIVTYLGAPFHVSLGAARRTDEIAAGGTDLYREYIDIEEALTTNSAFVQLHEQMGYVSWLYIGVVSCFMGFMFSWLTSFGRTSFLLPSGAILYGSAELWRLDLFQEGIFIVWFVMGIGVPAAFAIFGKRSVARRSRPRRVRPAAPPNTPGNAEFPEPQM
jgi:hypothetical protein